MSPRTRWISLALALLAACAFALSVWVGAWWRIGEVTVGPLGGRACFGGDCRLTGLQWIRTDDLWLRSAIATGYAGLIAMALSIAVAGAIAARRVPRLLARSLVVALATAIVVCIYFVAGFHGVGDADIELGFGLPLYFAGALMAGTAAVIVMRHPRGG